MGLPIAEKILVLLDRTGSLIAQLGCRMKRPIWVG
jgi:hypothetical protein